MQKTVALGSVLMLRAALTAPGQSASVPGSAADETLHSVTALIDGRGFVPIPAGEFIMGSAGGNADEQPPHRVRITSPFEMAKFEVTQAQWDAVMRDPHAAKDAPPVNKSHFKGAAKPVENVSWDDAQQFIHRLNKRDPQHTYRLPTEAEWEYASRAGRSELASVPLGEAAWFEGTAERQTHAVGQKKANAWGLHDMLGNVSEWVQDWFAPDAYSTADTVDPKGPASGSYKVHRGCAWLSAAKQCRPTYRAFDFPNPGQYSIGFRLVRTRK